MMEDYQQRVIDEKNSLDEKLNLLSSFIDDEDRTAIPSDEEDRMKRQHNAMVDYSAILAERISAFD